MIVISSWLDAAIRNFTYRARMEEPKRKQLDDAIEYIMGDIDEDVRNAKIKGIEELLNSGVLPEVSAENAVHEAARRGFFGQ